jgi:hypothetical protein
VRGAASAKPSPTTTSRSVDLDALALSALRANWREGEHRDGTAYGYTCPATPRYRHQWHWDSCFHAIAWRRYDVGRAREELRTVLRGGRADGFIPHTVFWHNHPRWRRAPLYATQRTRGSRHTTTIGPPLLPFAWEIVARASTDEPTFATEALHALEAHLDWLARERDGLLTIILPDESGLDDSPKYDPVYGRHAHYKPGYFRLVARYGRLGWSAHAIAGAHDEHVEDVWVNVAYALSLRAMARLAADDAYARRAQRVEAALLERCLDPATGLFFDLAGRGERPVRVSTWSALAPLALDAMPEDVRRRLVEEHLLDPRRYRARVGIPSVAMDEPAFNPRFDLWRTWRGPSWMNVAWLLLPAMRALGYGDEVTRIAGALADAARRDGLREYYDPRTGRGLAARGFGWSALVAELAR